MTSLHKSCSNKYQFHQSQFLNFWDTKLWRTSDWKCLAALHFTQQNQQRETDFNSILWDLSRSITLYTLHDNTAACLLKRTQLASTTDNCWHRRCKENTINWRICNGLKHAKRGSMQGSRLVRQTTGSISGSSSFGWFKGIHGWLV